MAKKVLVGVVMGSTSDWEVMSQAAKLLKEFGVKPDRIPHVLEEARQLCGI